MNFAQTNRTIRDGMRRWEEMVNKRLSRHKSDFTQLSAINKYLLMI